MLNESCLIEMCGKGEDNMSLDAVNQGFNLDELNGGVIRYNMNGRRSKEQVNPLTLFIFLYLKVPSG